MQANPDPAAQAEKHWRQWQQAVIDKGLEAKFEGDFVDTLKQVWAASDYVAQCCLRDPRLLLQLVDSGRLARCYEADEMAGLLRECLAAVADEAALHRQLRRFRREQMVRIIWRDLARAADLAETLDDLSALADAAVAQALELLYDWATARQGVPRGADGRQQSLLVLGMGKLGARELNLSSDIDLIFAYPEQGQVDGPRPLANEQFFLRLCQQLIKALGNQTVDGFVFRVDTRLRPFGEAGPLAICFDAMEHYYQSQAREWERYALIKARVITGDASDGKQLMAMLRPFIYRRYLDFGAIESLREMKQLISRELQLKGMADNIKLGPGGIREIEFIGQAFQLIRGGRDPELQIRAILPVLELLGQRGLLPPFAVRELVEAYGFLRLVENRIQAWQDRQTHLLPEDALGRLRLARSMGFADWKDFRQRLDHHRQHVQGHFDMVFAAPQAEDSPQQPQLLAVWEGRLDSDQAVALLQQAGFTDGAEALRRLAAFRDSHGFRGLGSKGRERLEQLMPLLLEALSQCSAPDLTLDRLLAVLEAVAQRTAYLALLVESPIVLSQLVRLTSICPWIGERIARQPLLLDDLLDPRRLYTPLRKQDLRNELDTLLSAVEADDLEQRMERLRQFAMSNKLRVAAADITGVIPLMVVSDYLTEIAETVTEQVLAQAWHDLTARHGRPGGLPGEQCGFAVIGYGKLGGIELGYGSDLDLVFLHAGSDVSTVTDGERQVSNEVFFARMGQRMIHMFTTRTPSGLLYEVDMRLRPNGNSGMLVSSIDTFEHYQHNDAWTWEHQALLRARPVAGDPEVIARFQQIRQAVLAQQRDAGQLRRDVREMRYKMRSSLERREAGKFDIKQGAGGIADIEFMVQYLALRWACDHPDLLRWTDNIRLLDTLASHRLLPEASAERMADAYRKLRAVYHRKALGQLPGVIVDSEMTQERQLVQDMWQSLMEGSGDAL